MELRKKGEWDNMEVLQRVMLIMKTLTKRDKQTINTIVNPLKNYDWIKKEPITKDESTDLRE